MKLVAVIVARLETSVRETDEVAAARLLRDLGHLAGEQGAGHDFTRRLAAIRTRHASKRTFVQRLDGLGA